MLPLATLAAAALAGSLQFTLPAHEALGCGEALTPCTDLDSVYLWRQDPTTFPRPAIIKRAGVRGMEGVAWSFSYLCDTPPCQYFVATQDLAGNRSCPSAIVQVGGTTGVPPSSPAAAAPPVRWYDIAGRRAEPGTPGCYVSSARRKVVIYR